MKRPTKTVMTLPCEFSQEEMDEKRDRLSAAILEYDKVEDEKKDVSKTFTDALKGLRLEMRVLSKAITRKGEDRAVDCVILYHTPDIGFKTTTRTDTGEIVKQEPMTDDERQENLFEETQELERMYGAQEPPIPPPSAPPSDDTGETDTGESRTN